VAAQGRLLPLSLAVTAGFSDAFGYLTLHGLLTAHVTGNLAFMAVGLAQGSPHIIMKFLALPLFMLGVGLATILISLIDRRSRLTLAWCLLAEAALFLLCLLVGRALPPCRATDDLTGFCVGTVLIMAMAMQNAIMRLPLKSLPSTTAMTTNVTEAAVQWTLWFIGFAGALSPEHKRALSPGDKRALSPGDKRALLRRAATVGQTVIAFALGGIGGGLAAVRLGYAGLLGPIAILALLAARTVIIHRRQDALHCGMPSRE
jgi:uncharacterized membrane protein YoaK (UPF0700 family)